MSAHANLAVCPHCRKPLVLDEHGAAFVDDLEALVVDGMVIKLTHAEWDILSILRKHFGRTVPHSRIMVGYKGVWNEPVQDACLKVHMCHLKRKLAGTPFRITNLPRVGYRLDYCEES